VDRFLQGDETIPVELHERLVERLHSVLAHAFVDRRLDLHRLYGIEQVLLNGWGGHHHLDGGDTPFPVGPRNQAEADHSLQSIGQQEAHLVVLVGRIERDDPVDGLGRVDRVQRREDEVPGIPP
jgi:hypothetical protein